MESLRIPSSSSSKSSLYPRYAITGAPTGVPVQVYSTGVTGSCPFPQLLSFNIHHGPEKHLPCLWKFIIKFLQRLTTSSKRAASLPDLIRHKITLYNRAGSSLHQCQCIILINLLILLHSCWIKCRQLWQTIKSLYKTHTSCNL